MASFYTKRFEALRPKVTEAVAQRNLAKKVLKNFAKFTGKHLRQNLFFNKTAGLRPATLFKKRLWHRSFEACNFIKKEILAQVFPRKFFKISKNNFLYRTPSMAASQVA